jgi:hypothetical protein
MKTSLRDRTMFTAAVHHTQDLAQDLGLRGALYHSPGATRGAESASLAGKRHQALVTAGLALKPIT